MYLKWTLCKYDTYSILNGFVGNSMLNNVLLRYIDAHLLVFGEINTHVIMQKFHV